MKNGAIIHDTDGNVLHAHGGWILKVEDTWYWYGENRTEDNYVSCYSSKDLKNWKFCNNILTVHSKTEVTRIRGNLMLVNEDGKKVNIERPKVIYNEKTKKYVMWAHFENGKNYSCAAACIATCDTPDGDFIYHGSFNPYGNMSRDCTLFEDGGKVYFASAARGNADMNVYSLQEDYLNVEKQTGSYWSNEFREAPAFVRVGERVYCFSSFCTGWAPNQGKYAWSSGVEEGFGLLKEIGDDTTYHSQPAFILMVKGSKKTSYVYVGDRWDGEHYHESTYTWYPLNFKEDGSVELEYCDELEINAETGELTPVIYKK
ncbi:family 43 glycosylhydrolase [Treponema sp.]|uniref:family 43 glycosylhydrolase n=1 Tax=Treponema sp. TaxID=166 RepID=UPI00257FE904|nr:family 43 glycosylhydrolase [Treponema sp.]MBE6355119.1 hypothetical protein [Treponema sp.]